MTTVNVTYFGMEGSGRNLTEAKREAGRKIEAVLDGNYYPTILSWRDYSILVYREPGGWHAAIIREPQGMRTEVNGCRCGATKDEALASARGNLAQLGWAHADGATVPDFLKDRAERSEFLRWIDFQLRYRRAKESGLNDNDAHYYGCGALGRPELVARVEGSE